MGKDKGTVSRIRASRALRAYSRVRKLWKINPVTRVKKSDKAYFRPKEKHKLRKELKGV